MNDIKICRLNDSNYDQIVLYLKKTDDIYPVPMSSRVNIEEHAKKLLCLGVVFAAMDGNDIVGILLGYANDYEAGRAYCGTLGIQPEYQGQKLGAKLLATFEEFAKNRNMTFVGLHAHRDNTGALNFYKRNGFSLTQDPCKPYEESVYFTKFLNSPIQ